MLDATRLAPKLYQGSYPWEPIKPRSFDVLVLCAMELQQRPDELGLRTLRCPLNDDGTPMTRREWHNAVRTADEVVQLLLRGARVLITCAQGRNRSGLVAGIVLYRTSGLSGAECVRHIQQRRPGALTNEHFVAALSNLPRRERRQLSEPPRHALHRIGAPHEYIWR